MKRRIVASFVAVISLQILSIGISTPARADGSCSLGTRIGGCGASGHSGGSGGHSGGGGGGGGGGISPFLYIQIYSASKEEAATDVVARSLFEEFCGAGSDAWGVQEIQVLDRATLAELKLQYRCVPVGPPTIPDPPSLADVWASASLPVPSITPVPPAKQLVGMNIPVESVLFPSISAVAGPDPIMGCWAAGTAIPTTWTWHMSGEGDRTWTRGSGGTPHATFAPVEHKGNKDLSLTVTWRGRYFAACDNNPHAPTDAEVEAGAGEDMGTAARTSATVGLEVNEIRGILQGGA